MEKEMKKVLLGDILRKMDKDCDLVTCWDSEMDSEFYFSPDKEDNSNYGKFMTYLKDHLEVEEISISNTDFGLIVNLYNYLENKFFINYAKEHFFEKHQYESDEDVVELLFDDFVANIQKGYEELSDKFLKMMKELDEKTQDHFDFETFQKYQLQSVAEDIQSHLSENCTIQIHNDYIKTFLAPKVQEAISNSSTYSEIYWDIINDIVDNYLEEEGTVENDKEYLYNSKGADSELNKFTGQKITIIRPLTNEECDVDEVGNMYKAKFPDGSEFDVFEDEIVLGGIL